MPVLKATGRHTAPGQLSLLNLGPFSLESPGPELLSTAVAGAVSAGRSDGCDPKGLLGQ